jgi:uncharacterized protein (TIGR00251 family)
MQALIRQRKDGIMLAVHVVPRSARSEIIGVRGQAVKVRVKAAPVEGAANAALLALLAKALRVPKRALRIVSGHTSRRKVLSVEGLGIEEAQLWLKSLPADD